MDVRELRSDSEIESAFPLMSILRERLKRESFLAEVRRQQVEGYRLYAGFLGDRIVCLAGARRSHTLARGEHLFVDDLVTEESERGQGHAGQMLHHLADRAKAEGLNKMYLDSRATAQGFYAKAGFTFLSSIPCWLDLGGE
jgi:GNAT superfamily N-acetyltransferase